MPEINSSKSKDWWEAQARRDPKAAGMLTVFGTDELSRLYRQEAEWRHLRRIASLRRSMAVLELGCGAARWAHQIAPHVERVTAVDFSTEMIRIARERGLAKGIGNVSYYVMPVQEFGDGVTYDIVYLSGVDQYLSEADFEVLAARAVRALKPGGILIDRVTLSTGERFVAKTEDGYQCVYRAVAEIAAVYQQNGLELNYHAPSHRPLRLSRFSRIRWITGLLVGLFRLSPFCGYIVVSALTKMVNRLRPRQVAMGDRSHDFLRFQRSRLKK